MQKPSNLHKGIEYLKKEKKSLETLDGGLFMNKSLECLVYDLVGVARFIIYF